MAKGPRITDRVIKEIATVYSEHRQWRAKEIQKEVNSRLKGRGPGLSAIQKELTKIRKRDDARLPESQRLDEPWSLGSLTKYDIPPEALPAVMSVYRECLASEREFTIREALWVARLHKLVDPPDPVTMVNWAVAYALEEWVSEVTGKESFNSEELDLELTKDIHSTPGIVRELEVWGIAEKYGADPVKLKELNLSIEETEEAAKSGKYKKEAQHERSHNQEIQE